MKIAVNVFAFNEEETVGLVVERIPRPLLPGNTVIVSVIDDGSVDETSSVAMKSGADLLRKHPRNYGLATAYNTANQSAIDIDADIIVNIDGDNQFNPHEIPYLIQPIIDGEADVVLGSRFKGKSHRNIPLLKRIGNLVVSVIVSLIIGRKILDTQCGFRCYSRKAAENLQVSGIFTYTQEMVLKSAFSQLRIVEVPVSVRYFGERKSRVVSNMFHYAFKVMGVIMYSTISYFGKFIAAIGGILSLVIILLHLI